MKNAPEPNDSVALSVACPVLAAQANISHGFFTRNGGVSEGLYSSLNCGYGSGDDITKVAENRARIAETLQVDVGSLCTAYQIHSPTAVTIEHPWRWSDAPEADAIVTSQPGIALGILTADCVPILFADSERHVIAAAHAGWKGAIGGVIEATLDAMLKLGATLPAITASIGPAIDQGSYEVGAEFHDRFVQADDANSLFFIRGAREGHYLFDLKSYTKERLRNAGVAQISMLSHDTCAEGGDFFSFRRATLQGEPSYGRQLSAIALLT